MKNDAAAADDQSDVEIYIPAMPTLSSTVGRIETGVKSLLRRRGAVMVRIKR